MASEPGAVASLWRYPVKSMIGEELSAVAVREHGLAGDRAFALQDRSDGKIASAKNPRKWPTLFAFRAALMEAPGRGPAARALRITMPDGRVVSGDQAGIDDLLSRALDRPVSLRAAAPGPGGAAWTGTSEAYTPDLEELENRETVTDFNLPAGTFFDGATVHLLTTGTLQRLGQIHPQGRFDLRRFRPNIVVETPDDEEGFPENGWVGRTLAIGDELRLKVTAPTGRCVMTTLGQGSLPRDIDILRTVVRHNDAKVGVYAAVVRGGTIRRGDRVRLDESRE